MKHMNEETKKKISLSKIGHITSEETKKKMSRAQKGKPRNQKYTHGPEHHLWKHGDRVKTMRGSYLKFYYGLSQEDYERMLEGQDNRCGICGTYQIENAKGYDKLCVDHNHSTGNIRGLLCRQCNAGIGQMKDSVQLLENAIAYLKKYTI